MLTEKINYIQKNLKILAQLYSDGLYFNSDNLKKISFNENLDSKEVSF